MRIAANHLAPAVTVVGLLVGSTSLAAAPSVHLASAWDLKELGRDFPGALDTFRKADAAAAAGRVDEALALFQQASQQAPESPAPPRRQCEILTDLGRRQDALAACQRTLKYGDAPEDYRAMVGVLMMPGKPLPTSDDFVNALIIASGIVQRTPEDPSGHAAMFDIAWRLGDRALMRGKLRELERLSPQHYETGRARRIMSSVGQGPLVLLGWGLLLALAGVTTARAVVRLRGRSRLVAKAAGVAVLALVSLAGPARAEERAAGQLSDFKLDDADPEKSLPAHEEFRKNPVQYGYLVMDVADRAEEAVKAKDYPKAIKYYRTLVRMAPDRSIGFGKICEVYELAGDRPRALEACRQAIVTAGVRAEDYERFVRLTLAADTLDQTARTELGNVVAHLRKAPDGASAAADIECRVAVRLGDVAALQRCTAELARLVPDSDNNIGYEWALATLKRDSAAAERALARARQAGVNLAGLERMEQATRRAELTRSVGYGLAVVLVLAAAGLLVWRRRELTGALARRAPPGSVV